MPVLDTRNFGGVSYTEDTEIEFPSGLPGFEDRRRFVALQFPETGPLLFLQSLDDASLCFITLPVQAVDPEYRLELSREDLALAGFPARRQPRAGEDALCLTVLTIRESGTTANLLAPLVVNLSNRKAVQSVAPGREYSHRHALAVEEAAVC